MLELKTLLYLQPIGELAEWSNAAVLKTVEGHTSGGSNPSFSANPSNHMIVRVFFVFEFNNVILPFFSVRIIIVFNDIIRLLNENYFTFAIKFKFNYYEKITLFIKYCVSICMR